MKESTRVLIGLGGGLALGALIAAIGNPRYVEWADAITPLGTLWINAIRMTIIPLVVALLITGVAGAADLRAIGRIGGRSLLTFVLLLIGTAAIIMPLAVLAFSFLPPIGASRPELPAGAVEAAGEIAGTQAPGFGGWLVSLIPTNPIGAAASGAMLQVVLFSLILALAIAKSGALTRDTLLGFFRALSEAMLTIVRWVVALAPIGVFALVLPLAAHGGAGVVGAMGFYVAAYSLGSIVITLLLYPVVRVFGGVPMGRFGRASLPAQTVAFASASSLASLPAMIEGAERGLEIPKRVSGFVLPLAVSTFKIAAPIAWTIGALFVGWFYGMPLGLGGLATVAFASVFLSFAGPGVPRGAWLLLAPLFIAIHLPVEGIGILIAVDAIPDIFSTVVNVTGDMAAAVIVARREGPTEPERS